MRRRTSLALASAATLLVGGIASADWWSFFGGPADTPARENTSEKSAAAAPLPAAAAPLAEVAWTEQTGAAFAEARRTGRPILVYVTADACGFCRKMERETWTNPEIARVVSDGFIPLKLRPDTHPDEVATLRVRAYPTTVLVSPEGKPLAGRVGFIEPAKLAEMLRPAVAANTAPVGR